MHGTHSLHHERGTKRTSFVSPFCVPTFRTSRCLSLSVSVLHFCCMHTVSDTLHAIVLRFELHESPCPRQLERPCMLTCILMTGIPVPVALAPVLSEVVLACMARLQRTSVLSASVFARA